jgi:hypothetical protein
MCLAVPCQRCEASLMANPAAAAAADTSCLPPFCVAGDKSSVWALKHARATLLLVLCCRHYHSSLLLLAVGYETPASTHII